MTGIQKELYILFQWAYCSHQVTFISVSVYKSLNLRGEGEVDNGGKKGKGQVKEPV